jgi:uncharacterized membrane protein YkvA (DUF1232 family)
VRRELRVYHAIACHPQTPRLAKWCLAVAVASALMPLDLIPDVIPMLGDLEDLVIIPGLVAAGLCLVPREVVRQCRTQAAEHAPWRRG